MMYVYIPEVKKASATATAGGAVIARFGDYNLEELKVPKEAWPLENVNYKGTKSFTVRSRSGAALWPNYWVYCFLEGHTVTLL